MIRGEDCAIYVIEAYDGYGTSCGDPTRLERFEIHDHEGRPFLVPLHDCVAWPIARRALLRFATDGALGAEVPVEGRIPSGPAHAR